MGIALGLLAAICWGFSDIVASSASRRAGAFTVVLGFNVISLAGLGIAGIATDAFSGVGWNDIPPFIGIGALGAAAYLMFYKALAIGPISIVSTIVSGYAATVVVLAVVVLGEQLSSGEITAILVVIFGAMLASLNLASIRTGDTASLALVYALLTTLTLGGFTFGIAYYTTEFGLIAPLFIARAFTTLIVGTTAIRSGAWRLPVRSPRLLGWLGLLAALDTGGYFAFNVGIRHADTAVVATASAPYSVIPILFGVAFLFERPVPLQWIGIVLVIVGLLLLGLLS